MSQPLGFAIGNALEVQEAIDTLKGEGPEDLTELCLTLGSYMVYMAEKADSLEKARKLLEQSIASGKALETFKTFVSAQGGDASIVDDPSKLPHSSYTFELKAKEEGYVNEIAADAVGTAAMWLGAGRATKDAAIDLAVGLILHKKIGDYVKKGETFVTIYSNQQDIEKVKQTLYYSIKISKNKTKKPVLIYETITN